MTSLPQWGSISCRWCYWSRIIACCICHQAKLVVIKSYTTFFARDKCCHLMLYLHLMDPHCDLAYHMTLILINFKSTQMFFPCLKSILQRIFCPPDEVPNLVSLSWLKQFVKVLSRTSDTHFQFRIFIFFFHKSSFSSSGTKAKKRIWEIIFLSISFPIDTRRRLPMIEKEKTGLLSSRKQHLTFKAQFWTQKPIEAF